MPHWEEAYNRELIRARLLLRGVPEQWQELPSPWTEVAEELIEELGDQAFTGFRTQNRLLLAQDTGLLLSNLDNILAEGRITTDNVAEVRRQVRRAMVDYTMRAQQTVRTGVERAMIEGIKAHKEGFEVARAEAGISVSGNPIEGVRSEIAQRMEARRAFDLGPEAATRRTIRRQMDAVDNFIRESVGTPRSTAGQEILREWGDHPMVQRALDDMGPRGQAVRRAIQRAGRAERQLARGRGLFQDAERTLVHEHNVAMHEAEALSAARSPAVRAVRWTVSLRHASLPSSPDVCDLLEQANPHDLGPGIYHPETVPSLPHPFCSCNLQILSEDPEDWSDPAADPSSPRTVPRDEAERILEANKGRPKTRPEPPPGAREDRGAPTLTDNYVERQVATLNEQLAVADDAWRDF